jgi:hypothetical protein
MEGGGDVRPKPGSRPLLETCKVIPSKEGETRVEGGATQKRGPQKEGEVMTVDRKERKVVVVKGLSCPQESLGVEGCSYVSPCAPVAYGKVCVT